MNNPLNFDHLHLSLNSPRFKIDICELEGYIVGLLSFQSPTVAQLLDNFSLDIKQFNPKQINSIEQILDFYQSFDWDNDFCPEFLFAQDDKLNNQVLHLKQFASGFLYALGINPNQYESLSKESKEFVEHLIDISQIALDAKSLENSQSIDFEQIYQFVRVGASLMIIEKQKIASDRGIH